MTLTEANTQLVSRFGTTLQGGPKFRVVRAGEERERRFGAFTDCYGSIIVREVTEVRDVVKYDYLNPDAVVLEQWVPPHEGPHTSELIDWRQGTYEPFYVFENKKGELLDFRFDVIEILIHFKLHASLPTKATLKALHSAKVEAERERRLQLDMEALETESGNVFGYGRSNTNVNS